MPTTSAIPTLSNALAGVRSSSQNPLSIETEAWAIYGQATWHATDDLRLTLGLRYSDEKKDGVGQPVSGFFYDNMDLTGGTIETNVSTFDDDFLDPALIVEFDVSEDVMVYASYKESYRSGGFNQPAVLGRLSNETYGSDFNFGAEEIAAYELGMKGTWGNFRYNAAAFYYDFTDKQTTIRSSPLISTERLTVNSDDEVYGLEGDAIYVLNENFSLNASFAWIDGEPGDVPDLLCERPPCDPVKRDAIQGTPELSWLIGLNYRDQIMGYDVYGNITYSHKDEIIRIAKTKTTPTATNRSGDVAASLLPEYDLLSARFGVAINLGSGDSEVVVGLWGTNLLDEEYLIDTLNFDSFARRVDVYGQPRSFGMTVGYNF